MKSTERRQMNEAVKEGRALVEEKLGCPIPSYIHMSDEALEDVFMIYGPGELDNIVTAIKQDIALHESGR